MSSTRKANLQDRAEAQARIRRLMAVVEDRNIELAPVEERGARRIGAGATLRDVAAFVGTSHVSVLRWENGAEPSPRYRRRYAEALALLKEITD